MTSYPASEIPLPPWRQFRVATAHGDGWARSLIAAGVHLGVQLDGTCTLVPVFTAGCTMLAMAGERLS